jgi:hypothetical protein
VQVGLQVVGATRYKVWMSDVLTQPLSSTEFLVVDVETNGKAGDECELTELGAVPSAGASCTTGGRRSSASAPRSAA